MTDAQKRAQKNYLKKVKRIDFRFGVKEAGLYEKFKRLGTRKVKEIVERTEECIVE